MIFDEMGNALPTHPRDSAHRAGGGATTIDSVADAVRNRGCVCVVPVRDCLMIDFEPSAASQLAVISAFYEIAERAPRKLVLACRGNPDRFEIFSSLEQGRRRIEALLTRQEKL